MIKELIVPNLSVNDNELQIFFNVENGSYIKIGSELAEFESSKSTAVYLSEDEGYIKFLIEDGDSIKVGTPFALISKTEFTSLTIEKGISQQEDKDQLTDLKLTKNALEYIKTNKVDISLLPKNKLLKTEDIIRICGLYETKSSDTLSKSNSLFERVVVIGAGKGADVVIDLLRDDMTKIVVGLVDDHVKQMSHYPYPVLPCNVNDFPEKIDREIYDTVIISFGADLASMNRRRELFEFYKSKGLNFANVISSKAVIKSGVILGEGNLIGDNVYIGTMTKIGDNNSISYSAIIGHHNEIGSHNLIAPSVNTSGSVIIGDNCIIPAGVNVINRVKIGNSCIFPVGFNVISDIEDNKIVKNIFT